MEQRLTLITLGVADLRRSLDFYEKGLGWVRSEKSSGDMIAFEMPGIMLALYPIEELAEDVTVPYEPSRFSGMTIAHNVRSEKEVDELMAKVMAVGGSLLKQLQKVFWGGYSGYFADPDGYVFEVAYNPFWEF